MVKINLRVGIGLLVLQTFSLTLSAQQEENIWVFGTRAGLDFSAGSPVPLTSAIGGGNGEANASVCGPNGQLLFYTEGTTVWDSNGDIMPNGAELINNDMGQGSPTASASMGALIVPKPGSGSQYYIFSVTAMESGLGNLYYSLVDMDLNNGLGDVIISQQGILLADDMCERITAVIGDRCNIWLLGRARFTNTFRAFDISEAGINPEPQESAVGTTSFTGSFAGQIAVSPNRQKVIVASGSFPNSQSGGLEMFDFNPVTGVFSNPIIIYQGAGFYGAAFSPDNSKLYGSTSASVYQFDLAATPENTQTLLGACAHITHLKQAPDGKIYLLGTLYNNQLSAINAPDLAGMACGFSADVVTLLPNTFVHAGLPNVVPVIPHDTFYSQQSVSAPCFATDFAFTAGADSNGWDFVWNTGSTEATISVYMPGTYCVSYRTPPCNFNTDTFHVSFPNGVLPTITTRDACVGSSNGYAFATTYPGDPVSYYYTWMSGSDTLSQTDSLLQVPAGSYNLYVQTNTGCDTLLHFDIAEVDFEVNFTASDALICMGDALQLQNTSDAHFTQFAWYFGDGDSSLLQQPNSHTYLQPGSYELLLTGNGAICADTLQKTVLVDPAFDISFAMEPREICTGDHIAFALPTADSTLTGLHWSFGDGTEWSSAYEPSLQHAYDSAGIMPVHLQAQFRACANTSFTDTVWVYALPEVNLGPDTSLCLDGHAVVLHNLVEAPDVPYHHLWSTGDTTAGLRVLQPGTYSLQITTEPLGCTTTDEIVVSKDCYTDIPNAFTPNGDGDNDYFFPRTQLSQSVSDFKMQVFNRWGQLIFETANIDGRGWDGRFNEKEQPLGVYVYLVDVVYTNGRQERYEGNVTLVR